MKRVVRWGGIRTAASVARVQPIRSVCGLECAFAGMWYSGVQVRNSARIFGDPVLYRKMEAASQAIKRDICFASSLYLA